MQDIYRVLARLMQTDLTVMITGESGTGKELVARALHDYGKRRSGPFVAINMAAIPRDLIESELFGHEKGAFTGANARSSGRFEQAESGTLFLDEIGDMPMEAQTRLLRVLQQGEYTTVGGRTPIKTDVRIIAATNKDLRILIQQGLFREDLFFRLNVIPIALPPLRERKGDVTQLVRHFSLLHFKRTGQIPPTWTPEALDAFEKHDWPGNVRELANIVERISIVNPGAQISGDYVRGMLYPLDAAQPPAHPPVTVDEIQLKGGLNEMLDQWEKGFIKAALGDAKGNVAEAARLLKTDRANLYRRMKRLGIEP
jgi:two-component system nitrogen regulation response regulator GlnG